MTDRALGNSASGMLAMQNYTEVVSNNIANMKTTGFKEKKALFATMISYDKARAGSLSSTAGTVIPTGIQIGLGVKTVGVTTIQKQGNAVQTENPYHVSIQGNGFFQIELPSGEIAYTRDGTFEKNAEGQLVTQDGFTVLPGINIPQDAVWVKINSSGEVFAKTPGTIEPQNLGQIELTSFANPSGLEVIESNLLLETPASGAPIAGQAGLEGFGKILQGFYEGSNVNSVVAVTDLIEAQRGFELNSKAAKAADEQLSALKNII